MKIKCPQQTYFIINVLLVVISFTSRSRGQIYEKRPTVVIKQGALAGVKVYPDLTGVAINAFLGIPYAEPPEGRLRFSVPERHRGWNGTFFAGNYAPSCPFRISSYDRNEKENCLYLNVWSPDNVGNYKLPVIVYLSADELTSPDPVQITGHDLAAEGVVVVSVSYRLNVFGSFCLGTAEARGNLGLLDQYLALLWVKDNINAFGGDPRSVTLMGHTSSAASVVFHLVSPRTKSLFNKVIIVSGSVFSSWYSKNPVDISQKIVTDLRCPPNPIRDTMECLRTKSTYEILRAFERQNHEDIARHSVLPTVDSFLPEDDRYLPIPVKEALSEGSYNSVPILAGLSDFVINTEQWKQNDLGGYNKDTSQLVQYAEEFVIPSIIRQTKLDTANLNLIKDIIRWKYILDHKDDNPQELSKRTHVLQWDALVAAPFDKQMRKLGNSSTSPIYYFNLALSESTVNASKSVSGDLLLLFGPSLLQQLARRRFSSEESKLSKTLKSIWVSFARRGIPSTSSGTYHASSEWYPYRPPYKNILHIGSSSEWNYMDFVSKTDLWNFLLPKIISVTAPNDRIPKELQISPDPAAGFRHAMYTLVGLVVALLTLLLVCVVLLKRRAKERNRHFGF